MQPIDIRNHKIGAGQACFVIAEAGVNHNGDLSLAKKLVDVAVEAGADAVKFQTFDAKRLVSVSAQKAQYQKQTTDTDESQFEMLQRLQLSPQAHQELQAYCAQRGILFMSTPFDETSADFLAELGLDVYKTSSGDLTNLPLLAHIAHKAKPMIISTGMSTLEEVDKAVRTVRDTGNEQLVLFIASATTRQTRQMLICAPCTHSPGNLMPLWDSPITPPGLILPSPPLHWGRRF